MRLLTWNINGIRTLPMYHPWNTLKTGEAILNKLTADIICFQEVKITRQTLDKSVGLPESYDAFFSLPTVKGGYSGVCVYSKSSLVMPFKAEEGLSGRLSSGLKPPLSPDERVSRTLPQAHEMYLTEDEVTNSHKDLLELDKEGRAIMLDFGLFVLINVYCPNETSDSRLPYKMNFHLLLQERVRLLVEVDKREVIVVGDINVCAAPIDHCDGELPSNKEEFWVHPARKWFHEWLYPIGPMVDVVRNCWPDRKGMFTCWNQKIDARTTNYGTRIDYFLLTRGLLSWFKHGDIQPHVKGSDHCPVYIDLHDQITDEDGSTLYLRDMMKMTGEKRDPPRLATRYWPEYAGKQKLLSSFFGKKGSQNAKAIETKEVHLIKSSGSPSTTTHAPQPAAISQSSELESRDARKPDETKLPITLDGDSAMPLTDSSPTFSPNPTTTTPAKTTSAGDQPRPEESSTDSTSTLKRKKMQADSNYPAQSPKKAKKNGSASKGKVKAPAASQRKLSTFFANSQSQGDSANKEDKNTSQSQSQSQSQQSEVVDLDDLLNECDEATFQPSPPLVAPGSAQLGKAKNSHSWSTLFARIEPPKCVVHGEPAREFTVNKPGPNKGKAFFICARPVGPGYDAGKDKRLREEIDPRYRCNFFKWSSEVKREALRGAESKKNGT